jgi:hypothetical protein
MLEVWKLNRQLIKIERSYTKELRKQADADKFEGLIASRFAARHAVENDIDLVLTHRLVRKARSLDVEIPLVNDAPMWRQDNETKRYMLTPKGRAQVRKMIDEEQARRFEVKTRWVMKLIVPLLAALIGIIGAITGLVAVLQHNK